MEAIKKKLAALKDEKDTALERVEEVEREKKETEARAEAVGNTFSGTLYPLACAESMTAIMQQYSLGLCSVFFFPSFSARGYVLGTDNGLSNHVFRCNIDPPTRLCIIVYLAI